MPAEPITYKRALLYDEVWRDPVRTVAKRYGVSDVALATVCRKLQVPLPWSGYWSQVRAGQDLRRPPLPPAPVGAPSEIVRQRHEVPAAVGLPEKQPRVKRTIVVPKGLRTPHPLVSEAARLLRGRRPDDGLLRCRATRCLDISVGPSSLGRALRIMNALLRALEARGLQLEVTRVLHDLGRSETDRSPSNVTRVRVADEWICFRLTEKRELAHEPAREPPRWVRGRELESWLWANRPRRQLVPNGGFELSITNAQYLGVRTAWSDGKRKRVEDCLDAFVAHLYLAAEAVKQHREELERARQDRQQEELRRHERERQKLLEAERVRDFEEELRSWRLARDAREYLTEVRGLLSRTDVEHSSESALAPALAWIEGFARRIDPLTKLRDRSAESATSRVQPGDRKPDVLEGADCEEASSAEVISEQVLATSEDEP